MPEPSVPGDHDLLIRLDVKMDAVSTDLREMKEGSQKRLDALESTKVSKEEVQKLKEAADQIHRDHERRLRTLERRVLIATGVVIALQILVPIVLKYVRWG